MIVHHWDTDGIASAAIYIKLHGEDDLFTPKIGNFYLDDEDFEYLKSHDRIVVLDMNLPKVDRLCEYAQLYIYDHHRATKVDCAKEHVNPFLQGVMYPSCTTVLMERFSYEPDYLVALGILGDKGPDAQKIAEWHIVENVMKKENITLNDLLLATELLDSSFRMNRREEVINNVHLVLQGIHEVLEEESLHRNLELISREVEFWTSRAENRGRYMYLEMQSPYMIISAVTRRVAWSSGKPTLVINHKSDRDEFYIRFPNGEYSALNLIERVKQLGYNAGGKEEVMGAILPKGEGTKFVSQVLEVLGW